MYSNCFLPKQLLFTATPLTKEQIVNKWLSSQSQLKQQLWSRNNSITNTAPSSSCWGKFLLQRCGIVTQGYAMTSCYLAQWSLANYFCKVPGFVSSNALWSCWADTASAIAFFLRSSVFSCSMQSMNGIQELLILIATYGYPAVLPNSWHDQPVAKDFRSAMPVLQLLVCADFPEDVICTTHTERQPSSKHKAGE